METQFNLPLRVPACGACAYAARQRCDGPSTLESFTMQEDSVIGCLDVERQAKFYSDLHKRPHPHRASSHQERMFLPNFIPMISEGMARIPDTIMDRVFGVSMGKLLTNSGKIKYRSADHLRARLGLPPEARVGLFGTGKDWKLEPFWRDSDVNDSWVRIEALDFTFATSCMFSVYFDHPRFDQIYNQERNLWTFDLFSAMNLCSIPFTLFSKEDSDWRSNIEWVKSRETLNILAVSGQNRPEESDFLDLIAEMNALTEAIDRPLHFLVVGVAKASRIASILTQFSATIATTKPFQLALHGMRVNEQLKSERDTQSSRQELFLHNLNQYEKYCNRFPSYGALQSLLSSLSSGAPMSDTSITQILLDSMTKAVSSYSLPAIREI